MITIERNPALISCKKNYERNTDLEKLQVKPITFLDYNKKFVGIWLRFLLATTTAFFCIKFLIWVPDLDHQFIEILHHRSIVTHSILIPVLFWIFLPKRIAIFSSLLFSAVAIHLSADALSSSKGYGAIWLPEPFKFSLGEASKAWLFGNAITAFVFSLISCPIKHRFELIFGALTACIFYGLINEESIWASLIAIVSLLISLLLFFKFNPLPLGPISQVRQLNAKRYETQILFKKEKEKQKSERGKLHLIKAIFLFPFKVILALVKMLVWFAKNPKYAGSALVALLMASLLFYSMGSGRSGSVGSASSLSIAEAVVTGAVDTAAGGVYVLHSSGGWIMQKGGRFVAGTLTKVKP